MGKKKTARVLARFYWPNVFKDAAEIYRTCKECQKTAPGKKTFAPLIPLPVTDEPLQRITMDLVGPLPRSRSGNKYILVICEYATRYPKAIPLRSIEPEHIAEELIKVSFFESWSSKRDTHRSGEQFYIPATSRSVQTTPHSTYQNKSLPPSNRWPRQTL